MILASVTASLESVPLFQLCGVFKSCGLVKRIIVIMFRAKLVAFGTGWSQHGEVYVCDEDERQLEFKISFFKWLIEDAGFWCYIERNIG